MRALEYPVMYKKKTVTSDFSLRVSAFMYPHQNHYVYCLLDPEGLAVGGMGSNLPTTFDSLGEARKMTLRDFEEDKPYHGYFVSDSYDGHFVQLELATPVTKENLCWIPAKFHRHFSHRASA